jgi:hypothetical protein
LNHRRRRVMEPGGPRGRRGRREHGRRPPAQPEGRPTVPPAAAVAAAEFLDRRPSLPGRAWSWAGHPGAGSTRLAAGGADAAERRDRVRGGGRRGLAVLLGRAGRGRFEPQPARPREVQLRPRVRVAGLHVASGRSPCGRPGVYPTTTRDGMPTSRAITAIAKANCWQ